MDTNKWFGKPDRVLSTVLSLVCHTHRYQLGHQILTSTVAKNVSQTGERTDFRVFETRMPGDGRWTLGRDAIGIATHPFLYTRAGAKI